MPRLPLFVITFTVLLAGCTEGASLVQPTGACAAKDVYEVYLDEGTADVSAAIKAIRAKHPLQLLEQFVGTPGFAGRMSRETALAVGAEPSVDLITPSSCFTGTLDHR